MTDATAIHGIEIIELVATAPNGIQLNHLARTVDARFGATARFYTCSTQGMSLEALLPLLETRGKVSITNGVVFPGKSPICSHCRAARRKRARG